MTTDVFYPDADTESTSVDGYVSRSGVDQTFANIVAGAGTAKGDADALASMPRVYASATTNQFQRIDRTIYLFDTSSIPSANTVSSATLSIYGTNRTNGLGKSSWVAVTSTPASNTALANADYGNLGSTSLGSVAYDSWSTSGYNDIALGDVSVVTKAGITKLGGRLEWDRAGTFGGAWASGAFTYQGGYLADNAGTTNDPKLTVVHTAPATARRVMVIA